MPTSCSHHWIQSSSASHSSAHLHRSALGRSKKAGGLCTGWKALLLIIPLRLGINHINPVYIDAFKECFKMPQSLGALGGKPNNAYYFIGFLGNELIYLDPHTTQSFVDSEENGTVDDESFHCQEAPHRMKIMNLDPSVALGFFCKEECDFDNRCSLVQKEILKQQSLRMFELVQKHPPHWPPFIPPTKPEVTTTGAAQKEEKRKKDKATEFIGASKKAIASASMVEKHASSLTKNFSPKKSPSMSSTSLMKQTLKPAGSFKGEIPKKPWPSTGGVPSKQAASSHDSPVSKKLAASSLAGGLKRPSLSSVSTASGSRQAKTQASPIQSQPNSQIRQHIRQSLKEMLWKRVNDSDDLVMTESEVGKVALNIEKEMFNLFQVTDNRYKSKYRSIMFNLKDPKNQGLFHRVLRGEISVSKLVRMKPEELLSKELSVWKEKPAKAMLESRNKSHEIKKAAVKREQVPDVNMEDSPPVSDSDEQQKSTQTVQNVNSAPSLDVFSSMLKDTTNEHRAHLFDLNCKICTGQISASEDELPPKKIKLMASAKKAVSKSKPEVQRKYESSAPSAAAEPAKEAASENTEETEVAPAAEAVSQSSLERTYIPTTQGHNNTDSSSEEPSTFPASCTGAVVTTVTVSGREPRTPMSGSSGTTTTALRSGTASGEVLTGETKQEMSKPVMTVPKSILTKPSSSPDPRYLAVHQSPNISVAEPRSPQGSDTSLFLSRLNTIWKGFINLQSVAKFITKAYPVSGCFDYLSEDLPDTIHIGGKISPKAVWDYVGKLRSSLCKELFLIRLIRFHPATEEEEVAYISLYSYFIRRGCFGVVTNNNRHVKNLYLIPLSSKDPIPSNLLPFEGPGLESSRPNLILGLVICQKGKRPATTMDTDKIETKRSRIQVQEETETSLYSKGPIVSLTEKHWTPRMNRGEPPKLR
eukprot:XP_027303656.1 death-inducer obliterator 1-like [Anas platyrhynchos]